MLTPTDLAKWPIDPKTGHRDVAVSHERGGVAWHEAAHAIVALASGLRVFSMWMGKRSGRWEGGTDFAACGWEPDFPGQPMPAGERERMRRSLRVIVAGSIGASMVDSHLEGSDEHDLRMAGRWASLLAGPRGSAELKMARARDAARQLLERHELVLNHVAITLMSRGWLFESEIMAAAEMQWANPEEMKGR